MPGSHDPDRSARPPQLLRFDDIDDDDPRGGQAVARVEGFDAPDEGSDDRSSEAAGSGVVSFGSFGDEPVGADGGPGERESGPGRPGVGMFDELDGPGAAAPESGDGPRRSAAGTFDGLVGGDGAARPEPDDHPVGSADPSGSAGVDGAGQTRMADLSDLGGRTRRAGAGRAGRSTTAGRGTAAGAAQTDTGGSRPARSGAARSRSAASDVTDPGTAGAGLAGSESRAPGPQGANLRSPDLWGSDIADLETPDADPGDPGSGERATSGPDGRRRGGRTGGRWGERGTRGSGSGFGRSSSRASAEPAEDADPVASAKAVCLRILEARPRTRQELAQALKRREFSDEVIEAALDRFVEVGLIDDVAFAGQWVRSRHTHGGLARRALAMELRRKGVDSETAGEALAEVDSDAEESRARELVARKLRTRAGTPDEAMARRLVGMLARKGYPAGIAYRVVKEALAEHAAELAEQIPMDDDL